MALNGSNGSNGRGGGGRIPRILALALVLLLSASLAGQVRAEGTKEMIESANGQGKRYYWYPGGLYTDAGFFFVRAYAEAGEFLNMGSSIFGANQYAAIRYTSPDGSIVGTCQRHGMNTDGNPGVVFDLSQEQQGPGYPDGGYEPCVVEVPNLVAIYESFWC